MTDEQYNNIMRQLNWIVNGLGVGGADTGVIPDNKTVLGRVVNIDQQVTGADDFETTTGPSVAGRVIDIQENVAHLVEEADNPEESDG